MAKNTGRNGGRTAAKKPAHSGKKAPRDPRQDELTMRRRAAGQAIPDSADDGEQGEGYGYNAQGDFDPRTVDTDEPWDDDDPDRPDDDEDDGEFEADDADDPDDEDGDDSDDAADEDEGGFIGESPRARSGERVRRADANYASEHSAASYKAGVMFPLSTGGYVRLRPFSLLAAVQAEETAERRGRPSPGLMPNHLLAAAKKLLKLDDGRPAAGNRTEARRQGQRYAQQTGRKADDDQGLELIQWLVAQMITSFTVVLEPKRRYAADEVYIGDIFDADQMGIVSYAMKGQSALATFRR